jgi:uncharacterized YigZ family protein
VRFALLPNRVHCTFSGSLHPLVGEVAKGFFLPDNHQKWVTLPAIMSRMDRYFTITRRSEGLYKDKGSKFLAFAVPVATQEETKAVIAAFRKEFYDARHVCYAYVLGADGEDYRANDDGEPSGTAGKPILGQIRSAGITNVAVVVVRYFGGVLLGTGGLVAAYKNAAADAIATAEIVEREVLVQMAFTFDYSGMNAVMSLLKELELAPVSQQFDAICSMVVDVPKAHAGYFRRKLVKIASVVCAEDTDDI